MANGNQKNQKGTEPTKAEPPPVIITAPPAPVPVDYLVGFRRTAAGYSVVSAQLQGDVILKCDVDHVAQPLEHASPLLLLTIRKMLKDLP